MAVGKILDLFSMALDNITHRRTRSFLTMLGIFIGVASVVALIALGQGLSESVNSEFAKIGADKLLVYPGSGSSMYSTFSASVLTDRDLEAVKRIGNVAVADYEIVKSVQLMHGDKKVFVSATGISTENGASGVATEFLGLEAETGRLFNSNDKDKLLVGYELAHGNVFPRDLRVNDVMIINNTEFRVAGVLKKNGNPSVDNGVFLPGDSAKTALGAAGYSAFLLKLQKGVVPSEEAPAVEKALRQSRGVARNKEDFRVETAEQLIASFNTIFGVINVIVIGIAAISLIVGAVGIMNTMYTAVLERTKEIGIMKAVGAKSEEIMLLFLMESGLLGLVGGVVGVILGYLMAKAAEAIANQALGSMLIKVYFPPELIAGALAFAFIVGSVSGVFPARQAAQMKPVDALRYE